MNRERTANKIITSERVMEETITDEEIQRWYPKLLQAWTAGYDHRGKELTAHNNHPVVRINDRGDVLERFPSITEARKKYKCDHYTILRSIQQSRPTRKGLRWTYETEICES